MVSSLFVISWLTELTLDMFIAQATVFIARGEFSIVIAALGADLADGAQLGALAAGYVLLTAIIGPLATKFSDQISAATTRQPAAVAPVHR